MDIVKTVDRSEVPVEYTWDLSGIFATHEEYEKTFIETERLVDEFVELYKGKTDSAQMINASLDAYRVIDENIIQLATYARLPLSANAFDTESRTVAADASRRINEIDTKMSFFENELLKNDEAVLEDAVNAGENGRYIEELLREKPHVLSDEVESALAQLSVALNSYEDIYNAAKVQDMKFPDVEVNGEVHPLSYNIFEGLMQGEPNTELRREAFKSFSNVLEQYKNVNAEIYLNQVKKEKAIATLRGFDSVFDYLLHMQRVPRELYDRQIDTIMTELAPHMRKYAKILKDVHGLDKMTYMDLKIDVDPEYEKKIEVEEGAEIIKEGLSVLGEEYGEILERAFSERWIDYVNNHGKSTGAFCSSPYGAHPFILISWTAQMTEAMTLAHELGHAGHFFLAGKYQNILNTRASMYFVEAPSTTNELIMANTLLNRTEDLRERRYYLSNIISRTYYHNFVTHLLEAAYQREVYKLIDDGKSFTADDLSAIYSKVLKDFWGEDIEMTAGAELTWMRQPHYYMGLYPYTYSAGLTIGTQVSKMILEEGQPAVDRWIDTLKLGGSKDPIDLALNAGVDISTDKPLKDTIAYIGSIIDEIEEITEKL